MPFVMKNFEFIEHTADIGIRIFGDDREELFESAAGALFKLLVDYRPKKDSERKISLEAETFEDLLVNWLNELISSFFACKFLPADYSIVIEEKQNLKILHAVIEGQKFDPYENKINMEIKAATYHNLKIKEARDGFKTEIIFDI